jgi:hypothetical protein
VLRVLTCRKFSEVCGFDFEIMQAASHMQRTSMKATPVSCGGSRTIRCCHKPLRQLHLPRLPPRHKVHDFDMHGWTCMCCCHNERMYGSNYSIQSIRYADLCTESGHQ